MAHQFGGVQFPVETPSDSDSLGDPTIDAIGRYLAAVLEAWAGTAWLQRSPGDPIVRKVLMVDPAEAEFIEKDLPALYVWRSEVDTVYATEETTKQTSKIQVGWVPSPKVAQTQWARRSAVINPIAKVITAALDLDRHPAWIADGDTDPAATELGSVWMRFAGVSMAAAGKTSRSAVMIQTDAGKRFRYPGLNTELTVEEFLRWDPDSFADAVAPSLDLQIDTPDLAVVLQHAVIPAP
jgi:hypothetical protein